MCLWIRHHFDEQRFVSFDATFQSCCDCCGIVNADRRASAGFRKRGVIDFGEMARGGLLAEPHRLGIALKTQNAIVEHDDGHRQTHPHHRFELGPAMGKTAVADDRDHWTLRLGSLSAERKRKPHPSPARPRGVMKRMPARGALSCPRIHMEE